MTKILVTGAAGFIGSNLCKRLVDLNWSVTGVDNLSNGKIQFVPKDVDFLHANFDDDRILCRIQNEEFDYVFHQAALPRVSYSVEHPLQTHKINVDATVNLINACVGNIKRFVFASSSSVYGPALDACDQFVEYGGAINSTISPTTITTPHNPQSPYALHKSVIEQYLKQYSIHNNFDSVCLRYFNVFGPNQLGSSPYSCAVSAWLTAIKNDQSCRSDGDGEQSRDLCYVSNVVDANVLAVMADGPFRAEAFNVACGERFTNNEILAYLKKRYPNMRTHSASVRVGDVKHTLADISKTTRVLKYVPRVKFYEGLERTIEWYESSELALLKNNI
jgi:UDP-N-acetylglucosamine 4-epimerase